MKNIDNDKQILTKQAAKLALLSREVEMKRENLRFLVDLGVPFDSEQMLRALDDYSIANHRWEVKEKEHLALKSRVDAAEPK